MLEIAVIQVLSILFLVGAIGGLAVLMFFIRERKDLGSVKASKPSGFILHQFWFFLVFFLPPLFYVLGVVMPGWVYGTFLNFSFGGAEYLQAVSVPLFLSGLILNCWSDWAIGQFMRSEVEVMEKHELVTRGPYSQIRHPTYTGIMLTTLASAFLFLHTILIVGFLACVGVAYKKAVLEEELLASEDGFGQAYRNYMLKTGRFLPKL